MRFKLLSIFLALQIVSFSVWTTVFSEDSTLTPAETLSGQEFAPVHPSVELASAAILESADQVPSWIGEISSVTSLQTPEVTPMVEQAPILEPTEPVEPGYLPHFSAQNAIGEVALTQPIQEDQIARAFQKLPQDQVKSLQSLIFDYDPHAHRGLGGGGMIIIRAVDMTSEEFVAVLIHELGHNVDYGFLKPQEEVSKTSFADGDMPLYETDPSVDFYRLSWTSNTTKKEGITDADFVSGYAASDPFEDFSETYAYYILHNKEFQALTASSEVLLAKYNFMKDMVFKGQVFETGTTQTDLTTRPWDITVLPYDLSTFLDN